MRRLGFFVLVLLLGLLLAADYGARRVAEVQLRDRLAARVNQASQPEAGIHSFPFLGRLLVSGTVSEVDVALHGVVSHRLRFRTVSADLHDVRIDRNRLLSDRKVVVLGLARGTATAEIDDRDLSEVLGAAVRIGNGSATISAGGRSVTLELSLANGVLVVQAPSVGIRPGSLPIPKLPLLPCASRITLVPGTIRLTCEFNQVPAELQIPH